MEEENIFSEEKEKEVNILRRKLFCAEEKKNGEGKGGDYLEKENHFFTERKKNGECKGGK